MLLGRDRERARLDELLAGARAGYGAALLVRGDPGVGKSALLATTAEAAGADGWTVLRATGVAAERELELAGLVTLLAPTTAQHGLVADDLQQVLQALTAGQPVAPLAAGVALLHLLSAVASERPVLVVLDDAQWIDEATLGAVCFAQRRLTGEPVLVLAADRPAEPCRLAEQGEIEVLSLHGLDAGASRALLDQVTDLAPAVALACHDRCDGNPLALQELAAALDDSQRRGDAALPDVLPLGEGLRQGLVRRLEPLPARTRRALLVVALGGRLEPHELAQALAAMELLDGDLDAAEASGVVERSGRRLQFRHPLLREVASSAPPAEQRAAHAALARAVTGDRRAWHLAAAGDPAAPCALDEVAQEAARRGAHAAAALAWRRAAALVDDPGEASRLLLSAGVALAATAHPRVALPVLADAHEQASDDRTRARAAGVLGDMLAWHTSVDDAVALLRDSAARLTASTPEDAADAAGLLASAATFAALGGDLRRGVDLAERAERRAGAADPVTQLGIRVIGTHLRLVHSPTGSSIDRDRLTELDLVASLVGPGAPPELLNLAQVVGFDLVALERWDDALALLDGIVEVARPEGQVGISNFALAMRGEVLWRLGRWSEARVESMADVDHHGTLDEETGSFGHATVARVEAALGLLGPAGEHARAAVEQGQRTGMGILAAWGWHAQGLAALAGGDPEAAIDPLLNVWRLCRSGSIGHPGPLWWHGDLLDAFLSTDRLEEARRLRRWLEEQARTTGSRWAAAVVDRATARLDGDIDAARRSVDALDALGAPFEAARSRLALADALRRCPASCAEREGVLRTAQESFATLGAQRWEDDARRGLGGDDRPQTPPTLAAALSQGELRVALAVGRGLTNREAARELALSPKTVDAHLRAIYRKLDLRSRTELALVVAREQHPPRG